MIVSPTTTGPRSSDTSEVISFTAVLGQIVKILVIVDPANIKTFCWYILLPATC